jgi:hypothetical protein
VTLPAHSGPWPLIQFRNHFSQTVGFLGRVISRSQGRYLNTIQHKHNINAHTHIKHPCPERDSNPRSQRPSERHSSCLRLRGFCDRLVIIIVVIFTIILSSDLSFGSLSNLQDFSADCHHHHLYYNPIIGPSVIRSASLLICWMSLTSIIIMFTNISSDSKWKPAQIMLLCMFSYIRITVLIIILILHLQILICAT